MRKTEVSRRQKKENGVRRRDVVLAFPMGALISTMTQPAHAQGINALGPTQLGQGVNTVTGVGKNIALQGAQQNLGPTSQGRYAVCQSVTDVLETLEINSSASASFLGIKASAKSSFATSNHKTTNDLSIVVYAKHVSGSYAAINVQPRPEASQLARTNPGAFAASYGDSYVSQITEGSEYYAIYTLHAESEEAKRTITAALTVSGVGASGSADASVDMKISNVVKTNKVSMTFNYQISGIKNPKVPPREGLIGFATEFLSVPVDSPVVISYLTTGYERVAQLESLSGVASIRNTLLAPGGVVSQYRRLATLRREVAELQRVHKFYGYAGDDVLNSVGRQASEELTAFNAAFEAYDANPASLPKVPPAASLARGRPRLVARAIQSPWIRGDEPGAVVVDDVPSVIDYLYSRTRIASITKGDAEYVTQFDVTYHVDTAPRGKEAKVSKHTDFVRETITKKTMVLEPGEFIQRVYSNSFGWPSGLGLVTTLKQEMPWQGKQHGSRGGVVDFTVPPGAVLLGFQSSASHYLHSLRAVCAEIQSSRWVQW